MGLILISAGFVFPEISSKNLLLFWDSVAV